MEIYYNKQEMNGFINYVTNNMEDNGLACFINDFKLAVFEYGFFLVNAPIEQACNLFSDLTFCHIIINNDEKSSIIDNNKCMLKNIIKNGLQKFNLHI